MKHSYLIILVSLGIGFLPITLGCQHSNKSENAEFNRLNRSNTVFDEDTSYQIKAFDALESNFADKNSFRLVELLSYNRDSNINSITTKIHISLFKYYLEKDPKTILFAKYCVFNDTAIKVYVNNAMASSDFREPSVWVDSLLKHRPN
jgi:hypothetical protein